MWIVAAMCGMAGGARRTVRTRRSKHAAATTSNRVAPPAMACCCRKFVPGCYALSVQAELPQHIEDILDNRGIKWRLPD